MPELRLIRDSFPDDPVLDLAVSQALLDRVAVGELPETLRLARSGPMVAFAKRDAAAAGYDEAVRAARAAGFEAVLRMAGGRAAVFHEGTLVTAHAAPDPDPQPGIHERFRIEAGLVARALRKLGVDARVGEVPGEYCPGRYSVNAGGERKLAGFGQRLVKGGSHTGAVVVCTGADRVRDVLLPVYEALGLDWDPTTAGAVADEDAGGGLEQVTEAIAEEYAETYELVEAELDPETLELARRLAPDHVAKPAYLG
jgi:octanoyl-[GcvH]:protein N-octanoyltransferase